MSIHPHGRCGEPNKTAAARLKVNLGLGALLRALWPEDFTQDRPADDALLHELQRKEAIDRLDAAIQRTTTEVVFPSRENGGGSPVEES